MNDLLTNLSYAHAVQCLQSFIGPTVRIQNELGKSIVGEAILGTWSTAKPLGGRGIGPDPTGGAYTAPQTR